MKKRKNYKKNKQKNTKERTDVLVIKRKKAPLKKIAVLFLIFFLAYFLFIKITSNKESNEKKTSVFNGKQAMLLNKIDDFFDLQETLFLDPNLLIKALDDKKSDFVLVDLRDKKSYKEEHIKKAIDISLKFNFNNHKKYFLDKFKRLNNKKIVVYSDNKYNHDVFKLVNYLINKGFQVKILAVSWNEFRYFRNLWLPESQWDKIELDRYLEIRKR